MNSQNPLPQNCELESLYYCSPILSQYACIYTSLHVYGYTCRFMCVHVCGGLASSVVFNHIPPYGLSSPDSGADTFSYPSFPSEDSLPPPLSHWDSRAGCHAHLAVYMGFGDPDYCFHIYEQ